jgi:hypothetical protein
MDHFGGTPLLLKHLNSWLLCPPLKSEFENILTTKINLSLLL